MPDNEVIKVSPSQCITFLTCERKWGHEKISGHREPEKQGSALGTVVHGILENYSKHGTTPDVQATWSFEGGKTFYPGKIALNMISRVMPPPGVANAEGYFEFQPGPIDPIVRGYIDLAYSKGDHEFAELDAIPGPVLVVLDHKTSSSPKKWGKTAESLRTDPQAIIYAMSALHTWRQHNTGELPRVLCCWNYGATNGKPKDGQIIFALFTAKEVFAAFKKLLPTIKRIARLRQEAPDPNTLKFNGKACSMYGGCPHRTRCNLTDEQKLEALMTTDNDSLLADLMADEQDDPTPNTEIPPTADGDAVNPPESDLLAELEGLGEPESSADDGHAQVFPADGPADEPDLLAELEGTPDAEPADLPTPKPKPKAKATAPAATAQPTHHNVSMSEVNLDALADLVAMRLIARLAGK